MVREFERIQKEGVTSDELARMRASLLTEMAFARDGHYAMLSTLNEAIAMGHWRFFFDLPRAVNKLTPKRVQEVARRYLRPDTVTVGYYKTNDV
jgi:zinc protease